jgi:aspartate beta-hydroxylase
MVTENLEAALQANDAQALWNLGSNYLALSKLDEAQRALARALELAPKAFMVRLHYAHVLERLGQEQPALIHYFSAITQAQKQNRWLSDETTAPALRTLVKHAMQVTHAGRLRLFDALLAPLREQHGAAALQRVADALRIYLGEIPANYPDPRQRPKFLYIPDLPATTYFARELFPWYAQLESQFAAIREELVAVMAAKQGIEPFLKLDKPEDAQGYLGGAAKPVWDAFFFYRHGERYDEHHRQCPRTSTVLEAAPLCRIREHAPEVCFSVLTAGTHILPHRGVTNARLVTHLPLIVPEDCAIRVGGEDRAWREGECFTFDDTFEHEAWNRGSSTRVVMLLDVWNPHLSPVEREAVGALVEGIGAFNTAAGLDPA